MKLTKHAWIIWGIALIVVLALMMLIPFARTAAWWLAASGTVIMFGLCAFAFARAFSKDETLESKVLGWSIFQVGYTALFVQIIAGFIMMGTAALFPWWGVAIAELVIFAITGVCLTTRDAAREFITHSEAAIEEKTAAWKSIRTRAMSISVETQHPDVIKLAEAVRLADPMPTSIDNQIAEAFESLSNDANEEIIKKISHLLDQRKTLAKLEKKNRT